MPTSKICGHCAACGKVLEPGEIAIFFGTIRITKDRPEPGQVECIYRSGVTCRVTHLQGEERCAICKDCFANIKAGYFRLSTQYATQAK